MTTAEQTVASELVEHFWPDHLGGGEVKTKWPRGVNATIERVTIEPVHDMETQTKTPRPVIYFDGISRGLICNKTNGRFLMKTFGGDDKLWIGQSVSLIAANRSNGTIGVDLGEPFEDEKQA